MQGDMPNTMTQFKSLTDLLAAYVIHLELSGVSADAAKLLAREAFKYTPHLYRGGYVIPGFGYSTERASSGQINRGSAGNPYAV